VDHFLADGLRGATTRHFVLISLMAGIGEETLFRGLAQPLLGDLIGSRFVGLMLASILFGLAHSVTPTYAVLATVVGAYLGLLWIMCDNLLGPITAHAAYDFFALWYLKYTSPRRRPMRRASEPADSRGTPDQAE
jgi:membrane protease YdiL (CAAX protease family)